MAFLSSFNGKGNIESLSLDCASSAITKNIDRRVRAYMQSIGAIIYNNEQAPITNNGYIYLPTKATYYYTNIDMTIAASNATYLLRDILVGPKPNTGIIPTTIPDFSGVEFQLVINNTSGIEITFTFADNTTPGLLTYFAYNGDSTFAIEPYGILYIQGYFTNNTIIHLSNMYTDFVDMDQYADILSNAVSSGYYTFPSIPPGLPVSGNYTLNLSSFISTSPSQTLDFTGPGTLIINNDVSSSFIYYALIVVSVTGGNVVLSFSNSPRSTPFTMNGVPIPPITLVSGKSYYIGSDNGVVSIYDPSIGIPTQVTPLAIVNSGVSLQSISDPFFS